MIEPCKIAIVGAGSVGCYIGACLSFAGIDTLLLGRKRIEKHLQEYGLRATDWQGRDQHLSMRDIQYSTSIESISEADYILLTVKSGDTANAASSILAHAKPHAIVVSFQNGVQNSKILHELLPQHAIVKAMVPFNVSYNEKGIFHCGTQGRLAIEASQHQFEDLRSAFVRANLPIDTHTDLSGVQWGKLIMNLNNAVNALSGLPLRDQLHNKEYRTIMTQVISEALGLMKQAGIHPARTGKVIPRLMPHILALPNWLFTRVASATLKVDPKARSSMYEDFLQGRKTEIAYLNGEIVGLGLQQNIATPVNSAIVSLVKDAERNNKGSPMLSAHDIQRAIQHSKKSLV